MNKYLDVIIAIASALSVIIPLIVTLIFKVKQAIKDKDWIKITSILSDLITKAEQFIQYSGLEKKEWVNTQLIKFAVQNNINFDDERLSKEIDNVVALTKKVNQREKDKTNV